METILPPNNSNEKLMEGEQEEVEEYDGRYLSLPKIERIEQHRTFKTLKKQEWLAIAVLCFVNLINYMDRYTMAGVLKYIRVDFQFGDGAAGLLQTVFVISYMVFAPLFGYLGDRYDRKIIMTCGIILWSFTTLLGSFMKSKIMFLILRSFVGIGEASYSTIAPTIISDLFVGDLRAKVLAIFYFAIPVGSGLGYILGSIMSDLTHSWRWALRVTPFLGVLAVLAITFLMKEPRRGESEGASIMPPTSWSTDLKLLIKNRSFVFSTLGFMSVTFVAGALAWWGPDYIHRGVIIQKGRENASQNDIGYIFGLITMLSGVIGVPLGQVLASCLKKYEPRADPLICAFGVLASAPVIYFATLLPRVSTSWCFFLIFFGETLINLNWSLVADMLLYVVPPTRRSTAEAFQILISHMFGDAGSPYLIGVVADALKDKFSSDDQFANQTSTLRDDEISFYSLQYSLLMTSFVEFMGGIFFLLTSCYIINDKLSAEREVNGEHLGQLTNYFADEPVRQPSVT